MSTAPAATFTTDDLADGDWVTSITAGTSFRTEVAVRGHHVIADEPTGTGDGGDEGPTPYDYLLTAIGSCTAMTMRMYAARKGWPLERAVVRFRTARSHAADCADCVDRSATLGPLRLQRHIELFGALDDEQRARLLSIADRCPVKQALSRGIEVEAVG